jgi:hypothetical protein
MASRNCELEPASVKHIPRTTVSHAQIQSSRAISLSDSAWWCLLFHCIFARLSNLRQTGRRGTLKPPVTHLPVHDYWLKYRSQSLTNEKLSRLLKAKLTTVTFPDCQSPATVATSKCCTHQSSFRGEICANAMTVSFMIFRYGTLKRDFTWSRLIIVPASIRSGLCSWWID